MTPTQVPAPSRARKSGPLAGPLSGQRVLVTRARDQAFDLVRALEDQGARPISFPTIEITDPMSWDGIDRALAGADSYDWLVFTSSNAVQRTLARLDAIGGHPRAFGSVRIAAVGKATAAALRTCGLPVDLVPRTYDAEGLLEAFEERGGRVTSEPGSSRSTSPTSET